MRYGFPDGHRAAPRHLWARWATGGDTSAFLRAVEVKLPEERQDSEFHTDMENANKLADAWSLREESHLKGLNDTNATMEVLQELSMS